MIDLVEPIGKNIAATDVVDARTLLQTPDTTYTRCEGRIFALLAWDVALTQVYVCVTVGSALFPWLRSYPGGLQLSDEVMGSTNGLFFQQLYAFTLIGKRTPLTAGERKRKEDQESFLHLLEAYVVGSYDKAPELTPYAPPRPPPHPHNHQQYRNGYTNYSAPTTPAHQSNGVHARRGILPVSPPGRHLDVNNFSDSSSDNTDDSPTNSSYPTRAPDYSPPQQQQRSSLPSMPTSSNVRRVTMENPLDGIDNVFDIVFKQQAIGMKLGADDTKRYAVVKECFEGSEAKRYPEIQSGVVILAVNGQEVTGLGLSRVLYRLREAPRPVVVRFGRLTPRQLLEHQRKGTWG